MTRFLEGDTSEFGYNLALTARATEKLTFAATYRSNVDLDLEGNATLTGTLVSDQLGPLTSLGTYEGDADVSVPVPAVLTVAAAYTVGITTVELVWDRTFWSAYEELDFNYEQPLYNSALPDAAQPLGAAFDKPLDKSWEDTDAFRLGVSHQLDKALTLMWAVAIDENPVPDRTLNFELPDSDALLISCGARYIVNKQLSVGASYLYDYKASRTVTNDRISGKFTSAAAHMLSLGAQYTF